MKKSTLVLLGLMLSGSSWAHYKPFTGFYAGLDLGLAQSEVHDDYNTILTWPQAFNITLSSDDKITDTSVVGGVTLGYSALMGRNWVLGVEGRANWQSLNTLNNEDIMEVNSMLHINKHTSVKVDQDFAILAKLGLVSHCKLLMYGLVGADWAKVKLDFDALYQQNLDGLIEGNVRNDSSQYESGLVLGLGLEYFFTKCSSIGLEYNYIDYGKLEFENPMSGDLTVGGIVQVGSFITDNNQLHMKNSKVFLKFNYYFA